MSLISRNSAFQY